MPSPKRVLIHSLTSAISPEIECVRLRELRAIENPARRTGALALHQLATKYPERIAHLFGFKIDAQLSGLTPLSAGGTSTIFKRSGEEVLKANWLSTLMNSSQRGKYATNKHLEYERMASFLGDFVLPQSTFIDTHPYFTNKKAMLIVQPYRSGLLDPRIFNDPTVGGITASIERAEPLCPDIKDRLGDFLERGCALDARHTIIPDILGAANLLVDPAPARLMLIDGVPLTEDQPLYQHAARGYLANLALALAA